MLMLLLCHYPDNSAAPSSAASNAVTPTLAVDVVAVFNSEFAMGLYSLAVDVVAAFPSEFAIRLQKSHFYCMFGNSSRLPKTLFSSSSES
jgi:hypothetical protein